jgi:hypothetical protein
MVDSAFRTSSHTWMSAEKAHGWQSMIADDVRDAGT